MVSRAVTAFLLQWLRRSGDSTGSTRNFAGEHRVLPIEAHHTLPETHTEVHPCGRTAPGCDPILALARSHVAQRNRNDVIRYPIRWV
jgi:hypothetical protein